MKLINVILIALSLIILFDLINSRVSLKELENMKTLRTNGIYKLDKKDRNIIFIY